MGIYNLVLGKGIIIPVKLFSQIFRMELENTNTTDYTEEIFNQIVRQKIDPELTISGIGHDAFEGRHGKIFDMFSDTEHQESIDVLAEMIEKAKTITDVKYQTLNCGDLMFIGHCRNLGQNEFNYYIRNPSEIIYGFSHLLRDVIKYYPELEQKDLSALEEVFGQKSKMWTFADDCCCCG
jgi:hypothetical protein